MTGPAPATYRPGDVAHHPARDLAHHPSKEHTP